MADQISNVEKGAQFEEQTQATLSMQWGVSIRRHVPIPIGNPPKPHRFDLATSDGRIVVACKNIGWTESGGVPHAKISNVNEAVLLLSLLQGGTKRYVAIPRAIPPGGKETLAQYYWRTWRHVLGSTAVLEVDLQNGKATVVDEQSLDALRPVFPQSASTASVGSYWVYRNWTHRFAKVHDAHCSHCNNGRGTHGKSSDRNGEWLGPFATRAEAFDAAKSTGEDDVSGCAFCRR